MLIGNNPVVSMFGGVPPFNPWKRLRDAQKRGLKLIVIDPRELGRGQAGGPAPAGEAPARIPTLLAGIMQA